MSRFLPVPSYLKSVICVCLAAAFGARTARAAEPPDPALLLPPDVKKVVYVPDMRRLAASLRGSRFREFYTDPRAEEALAPLRETLEKNSPELADLLSGKDPDALAFLTGGLIVAELPPARPGKKERDRTLVIFTHIDRKRAAEWFGEPELAEGKGKSAAGSESGFTYHRAKARPRDTTASDRRAKSKKDDKKDKKRNELESTPGLRRATSRVGGDEDHIYAGENIFIRATGDGATIADALKRLAALAKSPTAPDSLARSDRWRGAIEAWGPRGAEAAPDLFIYYDLRHGNDGKPLVDEELLGRGADVARLGLDEMRSAAVGLRFAPEGVRFEANLYAPEPRKGVSTLLFMREPMPAPVTAEIPGFEPLASADRAESILDIIPPDALGYAVYSADLHQVWQGFRRVFDEAAPSVLQLMDDAMRSLQQGLDPATLDKILGGMGGRWAMFTRYPDKTRPGGRREPDTTYIFELKPGANIRPTVERWLRATATTLNYKLDQSQANEKRYYRLTGAEITEGAAIKLDRFAKFCVTDRWLVVSPRFEHMLAGFAAVEKPASNPRSRAMRQALGRAAALLPPDRHFELVSSPASFRNLFDDPFLGMFGGVFSGVGDAFIETGAAPESEIWTRYFDPVAGSIRADKNNLFFTLLLPYADSGGGNAQSSSAPGRR